VLRAIWDSAGQGRDELDETCGHRKSCKNMKHVGFDGLAEPGADLRTAWRERLAREGKLAPSGGSVRDLVLGRRPEPSD
jgi:hypothetical protein